MKRIEEEMKAVSVKGESFDGKMVFEETEDGNAVFKINNGGYVETITKVHKNIALLLFKKTLDNPEDLMSYKNPDILLDIDNEDYVRILKLFYN